jgi:hypothetical protein
MINVVMQLHRMPSAIFARKFPTIAIHQSRSRRENAAINI